MSKIDYERLIRDDAIHNWGTLIAAVTALSVRDAQAGDPEARLYLSVCAPDLLDALDQTKCRPVILSEARRNRRDRIARARV